MVHQNSVLKSGRVGSFFVYFMLNRILLSNNLSITYTFHIALTKLCNFVSDTYKSETRGFDSWLTSSLRIECNFPLATSDVQVMSET